jgi:hypothetical protein
MFQSSYGAVEKTLAVAYGIPDSVRETGFRGWIGNLQKLGVLGEAARVGRGAALKYGPDELHRFVLAIELSELGLPPATAVALISAYWDTKFKAIFRAAEESIVRDEARENDIIIHLGGIALRSGAWLAPKSKFPGVPNINRCRLHELPKYMEIWMRIGDEPTGLRPRALVVNLSSRLRAFHTAFAASFTAAAPDKE